MRIHRHRRGFGPHLAELWIAVIIIVILAAIAIPYFSSYKSRRMKTCVDALVSACDAPLAADAVCPACKKPYAVTRDEIACPDPDRHLPTQPRFVRAGDAWKFQQTLPAFDGAIDLSTGDWSTYTRITDRGDSVVVDVRPRFWHRWIAALLLQLVGLAFTCMTLGVSVSLLRGKDRSFVAAAIYLGVAVLLGWLTWTAVASGWGRQTVEFERGRVIERRFVFGRELRSPVVHDHPRALLPIGTKLHVVAPGKDGPAHAELFQISESSYGAILLMQRALFGS